ncbi:MAG: IclR family transcriptional regulator [Pseudomonadota bacterium]
MTEKTAAGDNVRAVGRALDILMAFTAADYELSAAELFKRVDLSRPTLYRLLHTLEQSGFVVSFGEPQKFRLGPSVAHLAHVWSSSLDVGSIAQPSMRRIRDLTGETAALFMQQGAYRICIAEMPSAQPLSFKRGLGYRERIVLGASGRVILANAGISREELASYAVDTTIDIAKYSRELDAIRKRGYAVSRDELLQGAVAVAAPFFHGSGQVAGSLGIYGPSVRMLEPQIEASAKLLMEEARALSLALGAS